MKIFVIGGVADPRSEEDKAWQNALLDRTMGRLGEEIIRAGHELVVCSPFPNTADVYAVRGAASAIRAGGGNSVIDFHYPKDDGIRSAIDSLGDERAIKVNPLASPASRNASGKIDKDYGWLLPQIAAMNSAQITIGLGGRLGGSASLLFGIAQSQQKAMLPLTFLGGATAVAFQSRCHELEDQLRDNTSILHDPDQIDKIMTVVEMLASSSRAPRKRDKPPVFFISYPRARPQDADFVEVTLLREGYKDVFRDEKDFGAGKVIQEEITDHIHRASIFILMWCQEYACSPWCYDEMEIAIKRHAARDLDIWLFLTDDTRVVPKPLREISNCPAKTRADLERWLLVLIGQLERSSPAS